MLLSRYSFVVLIGSWVSSSGAQEYISSAGQLTHGEWLGWGADVFNNRLASPGSSIDSSSAASLVKTCSQSYRLGVSATAVIKDGIAYYGTWSGQYVALDYKSCKTIWEINVTSLTLQYGPSPLAYVTASSRTSAALDGDVLYFGTQLHAFLFAVDRNTGRILDHIQINSHPLAIITQSPTVWNGIVYVGCSSQEEVAAGFIPGYACCSFIGNFAAVRFDKGSNRFSILWNQAMVPKASGFAGVGVWGRQPSIDPNRNQVFIATGNVYSVPESVQKCENQTQNATHLQHDPCTPSNVYGETILAFDLTTGHINWATTLSPFDAWNVACNAGALNPGSCPPNPGPDADFGMAPSFVPGSSLTPHGKDTVVVGQKNGNLYAVDAQTGALFWALPTSPDGIFGGLIWGLAVDGATIYYTASNGNTVSWRPEGSKANITNSAFGAASLVNGTSLWQTVVPLGMISEAVPSVVNDVVFTGRTGTLSAPGGNPVGPGGMIALNKKTGAVLHDYTLDNVYYGNIAIVDDYVMTGSGYGFANVSGTFEVWQVKK